MMKTKILLWIVTLLLLFVVGVEDGWAATYTATVKKTYVDYNNPDTSYGEKAQGTATISGYNTVSNGQVGFGNTGWGVNYITYVQIDASGIPTGMITGATLTAWVTGSRDDRRQTTWGVGYNNSTWSSSMTYNSANKDITLVGDLFTTATTSSSTWEEATFDITDALVNDADKVVTLIIYETAAGGGNIDVASTVTVEYAPYHNYTVQSSVNSVVLGSGTQAEGFEVVTPYPRYQLDGTTLYKADKQSANPHYGKRFTVTTDNQVETITYNSYATNIVAYREAESFLTPVSNNNYIYIRCSGTGAGYCTEYTNAFENLPSGAYKITAASYANNSTSFTFQTGGNTVFTHTGTGAWSETTSGTFQVPDGQPIQVIGGSNNYTLDYVYVQRMFGYVYGASGQQYNESIHPSVIVPSGITATYESNNKAVATVASDGTITMHHNGIAVITAKATIDGIEYTSTRTLYVGGEPEASASFSPASPITTETFTISGTGYLSETQEGQWMKVGFGNTAETQIVETVGGFSGVRGMDTNGYSHVYVPSGGLPTMGSYFVFTPKVNGKLTIEAYMTAANGIRLVDVDGNIMEKISFSEVTVNGWKDYSFNTLLSKGTTYYVYAETEWMPGADVTSSSVPTLYLNNFTFNVMEGTTISLIDQSLLLFPGDNANYNRLDRTIPGFNIAFGGGDGAKYNGTFILRNKAENSEDENGSITITPRIKTGNASDVVITSVTLNTGSSISGSPSIYINGVDKGAVTANSTLTYSGLTGNTLTIKLKGSGTSKSISFLLNSITFNYTLNNSAVLDDSKGTIDLRFSNYVYGHTGTTADCDLYFNSPVAFYGNVSFWGDNWSFSQASTGDAVKTKVDEKTHFYYNNGSGNGPYRLNIGEGVCHLYASFAETDYFAAAYASTRLYSYDYVEEPALTLAPGQSYTVPAATGLSFALTATGGGNITLTNTAETAVTADGTEIQTTVTSNDYVTITNSGSTNVTISRIEVKRLEPELSFGYSGGQGDEGNVFFGGDSGTPTAFTVKEGDTDITDKYETTGVYSVVRAPEGVTVNSSTGVIAVSASATEGYVDVQLTVNPKDAHKDLYGPISKTIRLYAVSGMWNFNSYKYADHQSMNGSPGWGANNYNQARDTEFMEELIRNDGEPLSMALSLKTQYKMRMTYAKNNGDGRMHLFGKGSNEQNRARYDRGGILRVPVKEGMLIEINAYSNGERSDMTLDGCNDITNTEAVTTFYVDVTGASQYFIANRDGYIDIINPSSNLDLYINYIRLTSEMVFEYGNVAYTEPVATFQNRVLNQGTTTLSFTSTPLYTSDLVQSFDSDTGVATLRTGAYGSYRVDVTGSGTGLLAGKTGSYTVHVIGFTATSPSPVTVSGATTTFTPKDQITITNNSGLNNEDIKNLVEFSIVSIEPSTTVAYLSGAVGSQTLTIEGAGRVTVQAKLGAITKNIVFEVVGATLNNLAPVIPDTQASYTVTITGDTSNITDVSFDTSSMTAGILGDLLGTTPSYSASGNSLTISGLGNGKGGIIPIYASCKYRGTETQLRGVLTVAYSSHVWNFESDLIPGLADWREKGVGTWNDTYTFEEPVDASADNVDTKDWCFVRKMGVTHPESSIIYYYTHSVMGTNALIIPETEGLYLRTTDTGKQLGVEMDNERVNGVGVPKLTDNKYACRNLMILRGGQFIVPKVKPGQWIEVRWTRHQDDMAERLVMENLLDVNGKYINEVYKIGNCFYNIPGQTSTYMFQVAGPDDDSSIVLDSDGCVNAVFEVADNVYISIQQIELHEPGWEYNSSMAPQLKAYIDGNNSEAQLLQHQYVCDGNTHTIELLSKDLQNAPNAPQQWEIAFDGTLEANGATKSDGWNNTATFTYRGGWGKVYVTLTSYSQDSGHRYVANRNTWIITIGAQPQQTYPYTWDFSKYFEETKTSVGGTADDYFEEDPKYTASRTAITETDVTNYITNPNFETEGGAGWTMVASNQNLHGGQSTNYCAESWHSTFRLSQTLTVPNGIYRVRAQGFYRQDGSDNDNLPYLYANDTKQVIPLRTGTENSMNDVSAAFSEGKYFIDPFAVEVTNGTLTIGVANPVNTSVWCIWDNFTLTRLEDSSTSFTKSTQAHEYRKDIDTWKETGNNENVITDDYHSRKYWSYYVDGAQLVSHDLGILPETEGLGFSINQKLLGGLTLDMQNTVTTDPATHLASGYNQEYPYSWRNGKLVITGGGTIIVPKPGDDYGSYYIYIRSNVAPSGVTNAEVNTQVHPNDVNNEIHQYRYRFTANADAVISFAGNAVVYQIGVTNIFKTMHTVGNIGWATESRSHTIDHALTGHLTTNDADAYTVTYDSYDMKTATVALTHIDEDGYVPAETGIVLRQDNGAATGTYSVPLFYPAITTAETTTATSFPTSNLMYPNLNAVQHEEEESGDYTKFILTNVHWKYTKTDNSGSWVALQNADAAGFYRLHIWNDSRDIMPANTAYLCVPTDQLPIALWNSGGGSGARQNTIGIRFDDLTGIHDIRIDGEEQSAINDVVNSGWYTLDGQKLTGKPTKAGVYINARRKFVVK